MKIVTSAALMGRGGRRHHVRYPRNTTWLQLASALCTLILLEVENLFQCAILCSMRYTEELSLRQFILMLPMLAALNLVKKLVKCNCI